MLSVGPHAGRVGHDVSDVALLVHTVKQVGHGARGVDSYVFATVRLRCSEWNHSLEPVVVSRCGQIGAINTA